MSYKLTITVTKDILERSKMCGGKSTNTNCAIALAVRDIFPQASVGAFLIHLKDELNPINIPLPISAEKFIFLFDHTSPLKRPSLPEISFDIDVPDRVIDSINIDEIKELLQDHPTLRLKEA